MYSRLNIKSFLACMHTSTFLYLNTQVHLDSNQGEQHQLQKHKLSSCSFHLSILPRST